LRKVLVALGLGLLLSSGCFGSQELLDPVPPPPGARALTIGRILYWTGAAFDTYTTARALETPGLHEANPVMGPFIRNLGPVAGVLLVKAGMYALLERSTRGGGRASFAVLPISGGVQILVGFHNLQQIRGARR
jgi:hypothetical protein